MPPEQTERARIADPDGAPIFGAVVEVSGNGLMETVGRHGGIPIRSVHVGRDGSTTDVGDLPVRKANRVAGRVVLDDGGQIPEKTRLLVTRDRAWDSLSVELGAEGEFDIQGCPTEAIGISIRMPGYKVSSKNSSYDAANRRLMGRVDGDVLGLELLLEKTGPINLNLSTLSTASIPRPKAGELPRDRPLRGVEPARK